MISKAKRPKNSLKADTIGRNEIHEAEIRITRQIIAITSCKRL